MSHFKLLATSTFGLESLVKQEVVDLGYEIESVENGKVIFWGDEKAICRTNVWMRTADRVKIIMGEFKAYSFEELFDQTKNLPWGELLPRDACFPVEGKSIKSKLYSVPDCQAIVKKAMVESMKEVYKQDWFSEEGPMYKVEVALLKDVVTLSIDTSGSGLHKRGYRAQGSKAPLKETLAAALVMLSRWWPDTPLIDPMCGSGTIPIEAALIGQNIPPGLYREFAASTWPNIPVDIWREVRSEGAQKRSAQAPFYIAGYDIDQHMVKIAEGNAAKALGENQAYLRFAQLPLSEIDTEEQYGKLICNPPYGERLGEKPEVDDLYLQMGKIFQERFPTWSYYVLTPHQSFEQLFGSKANKKRKLYNGRIRVDYYQYFGPKPPKLRKKGNA